MKKVGILFLNLGGPDNLKEVRPFLFRLFSDPDILVGIPAWLRIFLAAMIALIKGHSSKKTYQAIGGGSPQLKWTEIQARSLEKELNGSANGQSYQVAIGMRASSPSISQGLLQLKTWGADSLILLPLFPQFSTTTTGSCFKEVDRCLKKLQWTPRINRIHHWPDHPQYIELLKTNLDESLKHAESDLPKGGTSTEPVHVLFSAHSLPMKIVERGDTYPQDVEKTFKALAARIEHPWTLAYQSRNGRMPWLQPYTEDELVRLGKNGVKRLVVVPISFVSDHIETLWELDQLYADLARRSGITHYYRTRSFNDDPKFIQILKSLSTLEEESP